MPPRAGPSRSAFDPSSSPSSSPVARREAGNESSKTPKGKQREDDGSPLLFDNISYYLSPSLRPDILETLRTLINKNGGTEVALADSPSQDDRLPDTLRQAEFILSESWHLERDVLLQSSRNDMDVDGGNSVNEILPSIVTPAWIWAGLWTGKLPDPQFYSTNPKMIFSGVVACCADIPTGDREALAAAIQSQGGQYRHGLTKDVTHLFALKPEGEKYESAMHYFKLVGQPVVLTPHWFDDTFKTQRLQPVERYLFPEPLIFNENLSTFNLTSLIKGKSRADEAQDKVLDKLRKTLLGEIKIPKTRPDKDQKIERTAVWKSVAATENDDSLSAAPSRVLFGQRILLSADLNLEKIRQESVESAIEMNGGIVVETSQSGKLVDPSHYDILITIHDDTLEYFQAKKAKKLIGTIAWLFFVIATKRLSAPEDHLLHSPCPSQCISQLLDKNIAITNYTGDAREYLKKLMSIMGVEVTPHLKRGETSMLVAASLVGEKTAKAHEWGIPVVSHLWVEECFKRWEYVEPASYGGRFVRYPSGVNFAEVLGQRGIGNVRAPSNIPPTPGPTTQRRSVTTTGVAETPFPNNHYPGVADDAAPPPDGLPMDIDSSAPAGGPEGATEPSSSNNYSTHGALTTIVPSSEGRRVQRSASVIEVEDTIDPHQDQTSSALAPIEVNVSQDSAVNGQGVEDHQMRVDGGADLNSTPIATDATDATDATNTDVPTPTPTPSPALIKKTPAVVPPPSTSRRRPRSPSAGPSLIDLDAEDSPPHKRAKVDGPVRARDAGSLKAATNHRSPPVQDLDSDNDDDISLPSGTDFLRILGTQPAPKAATRSSSPDSDSDSQPIRPNGRIQGQDKGKGKGATNKKGQSAIRSDIESDGPDSIAAYAHGTNGRTKTQRRIVQDEDDVEQDDEAPAASTKQKPSISKTPAATTLHSGPRSSNLTGTWRPTTSSSSALSSPPPVSTSEPAASAPPRPSGTTKPKRPPTIQAHASEPSMNSSQMSGSATSPKKPSPIPVKRFSSLKEDVGSSSTQNKKAKMRGRDSTESDETFQPASPSSATVSRRASSGTSSTSGTSTSGRPSLEHDEGTGGRQRRAAAGVAGKKLAADMADLNHFTHSITRAKGDARKLDDYQHHGARHGPDPEVKIKPESKPRKIKESRSGSREMSDTPSVTQKVVKRPKPKVLLTKAPFGPESTIYKKFAKLVHMVSNPDDCAYVVSPEISRTEKFVRAMPHAPTYVSPKWMEASAKVEDLLPAEDFILVDKKGEHRWGFKLEDAVARAKNFGSKKIFDGYTFYVTKNIGIDIEVLSRVITSANGKVKPAPQRLSLNLFSEEKHIYLISCPLDRKDWIDLARQGLIVYQPVLLLNSVLTQQIDWEGKHESVVVPLDDK